MGRLVESEPTVETEPIEAALVEPIVGTLVPPASATVIDDVAAPVQGVLLPDQPAAEASSGDGTPPATIRRW
ncbi:MAG: hypothetical protein MI861_09150, partial [Pirellulales bacterium]|nr:hypothetical protein [Pirellulales bacterium]